MTEVATPPRLLRDGGGIVDAVRTGSLAGDAGLRAGDRILAIDGRNLRDAVDFQFHAAEESIELSVRRGESEFLVRIDKHPDEDLGIDFRDATFDGVRLCNNSCFFCFLKGNPRGMRKTLYVKDDDYRLSFFHGNFVTLTNLTEEDWTRISEQRLSPINVSVHATDVQLRRYLLGNKTAPDICDQLRRLASMNIEVNTQVVLCPGVNDGAALDRTITDLADLYPAVRTVSIVPVGATNVAEGRISGGVHADEVHGCTPAHAAEIIAQVAPQQRRFRRLFGATFVHLADEYYIAAGQPLPPARRYDGFAQYENGIGMARSLIDDWKRCLRGATGRRLGAQGLARGAGPDVAARRAGNPRRLRRIDVVSGVLIAPVLESLMAEFSELTGITVALRAVENTYFGARVNVSGLLTSGDIEAQLRPAELGDLVVLPRYALDYTGARFLDDRTPEDLQRALNRPLGFASTLREVLQIVAEPLESDIAGAAVSPVTNGKSWVDFDAERGGAPVAAR
ncbi:MAG: DUF512 domain-containing protein [Chloroflexi bacterium]|nr:DUF512 domain-containing protein [Chloroflexota bacterium]